MEEQPNKQVVKLLELIFKKNREINDVFRKDIQKMFNELKDIKDGNN